MSGPTGIRAWYPSRYEWAIGAGNVQSNLRTADNINVVNIDKHKLLKGRRPIYTVYNGIYVKVTLTVR